MAYNGQHIGADAHVQRIPPAALNDEVYDGIKGAGGHHAAKEQNGKEEHDTVDRYLTDARHEKGGDTGELSHQDRADQRDH